MKDTPFPGILGLMARPKFFVSSVWLSTFLWHRVLVGDDWALPIIFLWGVVGIIIESRVLSERLSRAFMAFTVSCLLFFPFVCLLMIGLAFFVVKLIVPSSIYQPSPFFIVGLMGVASYGLYQALVLILEKRGTNQSSLM